jgi:hypothetical protein
MAMIGSRLASWNGAALSAPTVAAAHRYPLAPLISSLVRRRGETARAGDGAAHR